MSKYECERETHLCAYADTDQHGDIDVAPGTCSCGRPYPSSANTTRRESTSAASARSVAKRSCPTTDRSLLVQPE